MNSPARRGRSRRGPRKAEVWRLGNQDVLIMGEGLWKRSDGVLCVWVADLATGERLDPPVGDLLPPGRAGRDFHAALELITRWAREGHVDAMWWLGHFHEFGRRGIGWNGAKALGYYLAAIHRHPHRFDEGSVRRVLRDGDGLFPGHRPGVRDCTPRNHEAVYQHFPEMMHWRAHGWIWFPDPFDWRTRVQSAEGFEQRA